MTDSRTLRLAHPDVTLTQMQSFISYQRRLLKGLIESSGDDWAGRFAFSHSKALKDSKLDSLEHRLIASAVESFCGRRWSARTVSNRLQQAKAAQAAGKATPKDLKVIENAPGELQRLEDLSTLEATVGPVTMVSLKTHEAELLELHASVAQAEGRGHLHQPRG